MSEWKPIEASHHAQNTTNPIRKIVDQMKGPSQSSKPMISLSIGDPCTDGNLRVPETADEAIIAKVKAHENNGYPPSIGYGDSRAAVAKYWVKNFAPNCSSTLNEDSVILASGASHALLMAITALCNPGDVLLLPAPCFSLYGTIAGSYGIEVKHYRCVPEKNWEADLDDLRSKVCPKTRAILLNNPSNPCGSSFTKEHLEAFFKLCEEVKVPVIADEIYAGLVFTGASFTSSASLDTNVPRIVVGGLAKCFIAPGWRMGWSITVDPQGVLQKVHAGMIALSTLIVGPNSLIQATLKEVLHNTPQSYHEKLRADLESNARLAYDMFKTSIGLTPTTPQGAMYLMVGLDVSRFRDIQNGIDFARLLQEEENVQVLPGEIFQCPNFFRIVFTKSPEQLQMAMRRIQQFCARHEKKDYI